jgi:hypothetical protein
MTTAETLESMTDAGQFEILATRVLREIDPDCRLIAHAGVNAPGKTIPNPIDGFCLVPGSDPPRYVMIAFTLTAPDDLLGKWLFDHTTHKPTARRKTAPPSQADDGDLIKAGRAVDCIRAQHTRAKFVVWLCTNRRLDMDLQRRVYDKATELDLEVKFLEQSELRDFLDVKAEGQWLRQEHLGIEADQMSGSLLRKLSRDSHHRYANDLLLPPRARIVPTRAARMAAEAFRAPVSLDLLAGPSGAGKSVIAHDLFRRHLEGGGAGLWIPGEVADREASLSSAVEVALRAIHPRTGVGAGRDALKLGTADQPLLLVVDDVNRSPDPIRLLTKVIGWSRPDSSSGGSAEGATISVRIVCPVWDAHLYPLRLVYESKSWIRVQGIGSMARAESIACLKAALGERAGAFSDADLDAFAERLHDDPILLGLFGNLLDADPSGNPLAMAENVIGRMTDQAIRALAATTRTLAADYAGALNRLSKEMIRRKALHPRWVEVQEWLEAEPAVLDRLAAVAAQGHVCRVAEEAGPPRLEFRHDRVLEYHLSQVASEMLGKEDSDRQAVIDPFFTSFAGRAIARADFPVAVLEQIRQQNAVALVAAVPYLPTSPSAGADSIIQIVRSWLEHPAGSHDSMRYDALWTLARASSSRVLDVTEGVRGNRWIWEARLRNGDASAGAMALSAEFCPAMRNPWIESLIEEARTHHGPRLKEQVRSLLRSAELKDGERFGALCLAGYLGDPGFASDVAVAWKHARDWRKVLLAALWAGFRCAGDAPANLLGPMMEQTLLLQHDETGQQIAERETLLQELAFTSRHGFGEPVLAYLVGLGTAGEQFRWIVAAILDEIDHPVAIRYVVRLLAEAKDKAEQVGRFSPWAHLWGDRWQRKDNRSEVRLSPQSIAALRSLWAEGQSPEWLQSYAFSRWACFVDDLAELSVVLPKSPHYESAVWERALRGDRTVSVFVLTKINTDRHWFYLIPRVWGDVFEAPVDAAIAQIAADSDLKAKAWSNHYYKMSHLIRDIPTEVAERLLEKYWNGLCQSPLFIQAALYHGTPKCRELAATALTCANQGADPFKHVGSFFGFFTQGLMDRLTDRHLEALLPYLHSLDDHTIRGMVKYCRRFDYWQWAKQHLEPEMRQRVGLAKPDVKGNTPLIVRATRRWFATDDELFAELDRIEQIDRPHRAAHLSRWWDAFVERSDAEDRAGRLLLAWLAGSQSPARFVAAAELVGARGKRRDLQALLQLKPAEDNPEVRRAAADAEFAVKRRSLD